jgi:carbon-monoxide dehydrogenase medium subunit
MIPFELSQPRSLDQALALLDGGDPDVRPCAGGTALMLMMKAGLLKLRRLVSLQSIGREHARIRVTDAGELRIGALACLADLEHSALLQQAVPAMGPALGRLSNVRVRNVATLGGSLAHADPHMDLPPLLCALDARVSIAGPRGSRMMPVEDLITGYLQTAVGRDELITEVVLPLQRPRSVAYLKCTTRSADDWPALGIAVSLELEAGAVRSCSVVVGAATDRPTRVHRAEAELLGRDAGDPAVLRRAAEAAAALTLESDAQGSAEYKRQLLRVYAARAILAARAAAPGTASADLGR